MRFMAQAPGPESDGRHLVIALTRKPRQSILMAEISGERLRGNGFRQRPSTVRFPQAGAVSSTGRFLRNPPHGPMAEAAGGNGRFYLLRPGHRPVTGGIGLLIDFTDPT